MKDADKAGVVLTSFVKWVNDTVPEDAVDVVLCAHNGNACDFLLLAKELTTHGLSLPDKITMTFNTLSVTKQHKQIDYHAASAADWPVAEQAEEGGPGEGRNHWHSVFDAEQYRRLHPGDETWRRW